MWQVTGDMWHVTHDTHDTWHIVCDEHSLKILAPQLFWFGIESVWKIFWLNDELLNEISDGGDCKTAPATLGLLKNCEIRIIFF